MICFPLHWPWHGKQFFPHTLSIHNFFHSHFRLNNMRKDNNNDNSSAKTNLAIVHGSMDFFRYLQEHSRDRFSRFEAYLYMLDKACTNYRPQNIDAKWIPAIGDGQFFITKTELAADWRWHRATVRDFLAKLTEFGCIVIEEHLKGILCTMRRLVVTVNPSVAISSSFEAMVKYAMYSWADGKLSSSQIIRLIGQIERGAKEMLADSMVSGYTKKQLEDITRLAVHYAIESIIASYPGELRASKEIGCDSSLIDKRAVEFLDGYLDGNWKAFLSLLFNKTEVALDLLVESMHLESEERDDIFRELAEKAIGRKMSSQAGHADSNDASIPLPAALPSDNLFAPLNNPEQADADGQDESSSENGFKADDSCPTNFRAKVASADA